MKHEVKCKLCGRHIGSSPEENILMFCEVCEDQAEDYCYFDKEVD